MGLRSSLGTRALAASAACLLTVVSAAPAVAQVTRDDGHKQLLGKVVDAASGTPLHGAFVSIDWDDTGYLTHDDGSFALPVWPRGEYRVTVELLGYADLEVSVPGPDVEPFVLRMSADPIILEGLTVQVDRLESRRNRVPVSVSYASREDLLSAPLSDVVDWIEGRYGIATTFCGSDGLGAVRQAGLFSDQSQDCVLRRGRWIRPTVYVDEMPLIGGLESLRFFSPQDLHSIEVYDRGSHIRAYTPHFMELVAKGRRFIAPVIPELMFR